jgi:hypothetical protein
MIKLAVSLTKEGPMMADLPNDNSSSVSKRVARRCAFEGCPKTSERPFADGWADLGGWGPGVPDGMYCPEHAAALEAIHWDILDEQERAGPRRKRDPPDRRSG